MLNTGLKHERKINIYITSCRREPIYATQRCAAQSSLRKPLHTKLQCISILKLLKAAECRAGPEAIMQLCTHARIDSLWYLALCVVDRSQELRHPGDLCLDRVKLSCGWKWAYQMQVDAGCARTHFSRTPLK